MKIFWDLTIKQKDYFENEFFDNLGYDEIAVNKFGC
jgi:hypothetical protein